MSKNATTGQAQNKANRSRLGRGLSSLMQVNNPSSAPGAPGATSGASPTSPDPAAQAASGPLMDVDPALVDPNPHQPRKNIPPAALAELAASLKSNGVIQPLIVIRKADGRFELIAGERRLRAARIAKLTTIPVVIREVDVYEQAQMALVENIQREDLNPIDRAQAYQALQKQLGLSHGELAGRLGEDRSTIANYTRLLDLCEPVRATVRDGALPLGHAKVLAGVSDEAEQVRLADLVIKQNLSVRNLERLVKGEEESAPRTNQKPQDEADSRVRHLNDLAQTVGRQIGMRCSLTPTGKSGGKLTLHFKSLDQFDSLMTRLDIDLE